MATLIEEINLRVEAYGDREQTIQAIEKEWAPIPDFMFKQRSGPGGNNIHPLWTKEERDILLQGMEEIAKKINKSREAVRAKLYFEGFI